MYKANCGQKWFLNQPHSLVCCAWLLRITAIFPSQIAAIFPAQTSNWNWHSCFLTQFYFSIQHYKEMMQQRKKHDGMFYGRSVPKGDEKKYLKVGPYFKSIRMVCVYCWSVGYNGTVFWVVVCCEWMCLFTVVWQWIVEIAEPKNETLIREVNG